MAESLPIKVQYFAILREQRGQAEEVVTTEAGTPGELFAQLRVRHGFTLAPAMVRAAVNGDFAPMDRRLASGDIVVFIPPVAGG